MDGNVNSHQNLQLTEKFVEKKLEFVDERLFCFLFFCVVFGLTFVGLVVFSEDSFRFNSGITKFFGRERTEINWPMKMKRHAKFSLWKFLNEIKTNIETVVIYVKKKTGMMKKTTISLKIFSIFLNVLKSIRLRRPCDFGTFKPAD